MTGLPTLSGAAQSTSSDASRDKGAHDAPTFPRLNVLNAITTMLAPVANTAPARVGSVPERVADPAGRRPAGELADAATAGNAPVPPGSQPHEPSVLTRDHEAAVIVAATPLSVTGEWQVAAGSGEFRCGYDIALPAPAAGTAPLVGIAYLLRRLHRAPSEGGNRGAEQCR